MTRRCTRSRSWPFAAAAGLAVCLAAAAATSCDKMPLTAPTDSTITLFANSTTVGLNGSIEITATVIESAGTPVQNGTVVTFTTTLGTIEPNEARTNNGKVTVKLLAGTRSGTAEVRAFSGGTSSGDALTVTVGAAAAGKVELLGNPSALPAAGGVVQLTAIVSDASGNRLSGIPVNFATDAGVLAPTSATSDGNGEARASLTTTAKARVTASVVGGTSASLSATLDIPVRVGPTVTISVPASSLVPGVPATFNVAVNGRRRGGPLGLDRVRRRRQAGGVDLRQQHRHPRVQLERHLHRHRRGDRHGRRDRDGHRVGQRAGGRGVRQHDGDPGDGHHRRASRVLRDGDHDAGRHARSSATSGTSATARSGPRPGTRRATCTRSAGAGATWCRCAR